MWTLVAMSLLAPPPLGDFPAAVFPSDGSVAPANARIWAYGDPAPSPDLVGLSIDVDGVVQTPSFEVLGCCALVATPAPPLTEGATVTVTVSSANGDVTSTFSVGAADGTAPTMPAYPTAIDHGPTPDGAAYQVVIGADGDDDNEVAALVARQDGGVVGTSAPGYILLARVPTPPAGELCIDVQALDVAFNASFPALAACVTVEGAEGEGEGDGGEGEGEGEAAGCSATSAHYAGGGAPLGALALVALLASRLRSRSRTTT